MTTGRRGRIRDYTLWTRRSDRLTDRGLSRCYYLTMWTFPLSGTGIRPIAETWLMRKEQVIDVLILYGESGQRRQLPVEWFEVTEDEGTLTLLVRPYPDRLLVALARSASVWHRRMDGGGD